MTNYDKVLFFGDKSTMKYDISGNELGAPSPSSPLIP